MAAELERLEARKVVLAGVLASRPPAPPRLHPGLAEVYKAKVTGLHAALNEPASRTEAAEILRLLIDEVRLVPEDGRLAIELVGDGAREQVAGCTGWKTDHDPERTVGKSLRPSRIRQRRETTRSGSGGASRNDPQTQARRKAAGRRPAHHIIRGSRQRQVG